jgi:hypothetical protein
MPAKSSDSRYNGLNPQDLGFVNVDDDTSSTYGFIITSPDNASTSESTASSTFTVKLSTAPTADVTMTYYSSDTTEGIVSGSSLVFTPNSDNWSTAQIITVTGVNDSTGDGDKYYQVVLMPVTSNDTNYNGADPQDMAFTNLDDDSSSSSAGGGFIITAPDNATTSEGGDNASFTVKLNMAPTSPVTIPVYVSDNTEALLTSGSYSSVDNLTLTFDTSSNLWSTPQTITVTGQGPDSDYETGYSVILMPASSSDINYNGANPQDIEFVNIEWNILFLYNAGTTNANMSGKLGADATCNAHSNKPTGTSGYAFTSFDSSNEIRDLPTTAGIDQNSPIYSLSGIKIGDNFADLLDSSIDSTLNNAGVLSSSSDKWWSFSIGGTGEIHSSRICNSGTTDNSSEKGTSGRSDVSNNSFWIHSGDSFCNDNNYLLCIAKP